MESKKKIEIELPIELTDVKLIDFNVISELPESLKKSGLSRDKVQFEFNIEMKINASDESIVIEANTKYFADKEKTIYLGNIVSSGEFKVSNINESMNKTKGQLPNAFLASLMGIVLSSARGMLVIKSKNTIMEGIILPPINPLSFFPVK